MLFDLEACEKNKNGNDSTAAMNADGSYAPGTRRSAQNIGQQPDFSITDPVQLEWKLQRQRSTEGGESSNNSGDDGAADHYAKRTKLDTIEEIDDRDPMRSVYSTHRSYTE